MGLNEALLELERQAAVVASYLDPDDEELLLHVADAWAPFPTTQCSVTQRKRWALNWVEWLFEAASRWEARPSEPSVDDLHRLLIRWATGTPPTQRQGLDRVYYSNVDQIPPLSRDNGTVQRRQAPPRQG